MFEVEERVRKLNERPVGREGRCVVYWAQANRRAASNHGLEYAASLANRAGLPLLFFEELDSTEPYSSDRSHAFVLEGVAATREALGRRGIGYCFHLRRNRRDRGDAILRLAGNAAALVTDDYPLAPAAAWNARLAERAKIACYAVDSSCVVPMQLIPAKQYAAYTIRPKIHKLLASHLTPVERVPLKRAFDPPLPDFHSEVSPRGIPDLLRSCDIDHAVRPSLSFRGGSTEARKHLAHFLRDNLKRYPKDRNEPSAHATSNLSPYLHFGHISPLEAALDARLHAEENGSSAAEFLEELIVRRELAFNHTRFAADPASLEHLPDWARKTLTKHAGDARPHLYSSGQFERAETHDALWNATQKEMLLRGKIHGYYRMYWGKKIIEWSASAEEACRTMVYLHDRYALDGRDPNTYTNILWCLGLHDRPWQERPVFGMIRYMSLDGMRRKTDVDAYIREIEYLALSGEDPFRLQ